MQVFAAHLMGQNNQFISLVCFAGLFLDYKQRSRWKKCFLTLSDSCDTPYLPYQALFYVMTLFDCEVASGYAMPPLDGQ